MSIHNCWYYFPWLRCFSIRLSRVDDDVLIEAISRMLRYLTIKIPVVVSRHVALYLDNESKVRAVSGIQREITCRRPDVVNDNFLKNAAWPTGRLSCAQNSVHSSEQHTTLHDGWTKSGAAAPVMKLRNRRREKALRLLRRTDPDYHSPFFLYLFPSLFLSPSRSLSFLALVFDEISRTIQSVDSGSTIIILRENVWCVRTARGIRLEFGRNQRTFSYDKRVNW